MDNLASTFAYIQFTIAHSLKYLLQLSAILFFMFILNSATLGRLGVLGIIPRKIYGLQGVICAPFIHATFNHLFFNLIPLLILSEMLIFYGFDFYWQISWILIIFSGLLTWVFARPGIHIGSSALVTAYWGFLVTNSFYDPSHIINLAIGFICVYYFIGIFIGIFPSQDKVSWEGHLMGLTSGIIVYLLAYYFPFFHHLLFEAPYWIPIPNFIEHPMIEN
jgi:membrane associated rhomboid family serine protease